LRAKSEFDFGQPTRYALADIRNRGLVSFAVFFPQDLSRDPLGGECHKSLQSE
jgi:hypothetical protein